MERADIRVAKNKKMRTSVEMIQKNYAVIFANARRRRNQYRNDARRNPAAQSAVTCDAGNLPNMGENEKLAEASPMFKRDV